MGSIKRFRAWDNRTKQWAAYGFHVLGEVNAFDLVGQFISENKGENETTLGRLGDIELDQSTGLFDRDGKEVYENDVDEYGYVVSYVTPEDDVEIEFEVPCSGTDTGLAIVYDYCGFLLCRKDDHKYAGAFMDKDVKIIGNTRQHPELPLDW